jgi:hypothetical protein
MTVDTQQTCKYKQLQKASNQKLEWNPVRPSERTQFATVPSNSGPLQPRA